MTEPSAGQTPAPAAAPEPLPWLEELPPRQIVAELDRYIVGQDAAKRAVAIAIRNRWRRSQAPEAIRDEIVPNNIMGIVHDTNESAIKTALQNNGKIPGDRFRYADINFILLGELVPKSIAIRLAERVAGNLLVDLQLFDEYRGKGIDSGRKSLALGLTLQDSSRTLKEQEVEALIAGIVEVLGSQLGAQLRR